MATLATSGRPGRRPSGFALIGMLPLLFAIAIPAQGAWRAYNVGDGLIHNNVRRIVEDQAENLWFATEGGVSHYDGVTWKSITTADGFPFNNVLSALVAQDGGVWFGCAQGGVALIRHDALQTIHPPAALALYPIWNISQGRGNRLWFASLGGGAFWYDGESWGGITSGMPSNNLLCVIEDHNGDLWVGTNGLGVGRRQGNTWTQYRTANGLAGEFVRQIVEDAQHNLWFATNRGVSRRDPNGVWQSYTTAEGLVGNDVYSILQDRQGAMWFGTRFQGVSRFDGRSWERYPILDGLGSWGITQDSSGNLWFGSTGGATRYDGSELKTFPELSNQAVETVFTIMEDSKGAIWFGTSGPARRFDGMTWSEFSTASTGGRLAGDILGSVLEDRAGNYWFQSYGQGVTRWDGDTTWTRFTAADGLASNSTHLGYEDRDGRIWVTSIGGVSVFDGTAWASLHQVDGLAGDNTRWVTQAQDGAMWITTSDSGVSRFASDSTWTTYTTQDGLAFDSVWGVFQDRDGAMWFGTGRGATRFDGSTWTTFTREDGLFNDNVLTVSQDRAGHLWFALDLSGGICRWDGTEWRNLGAAEGLTNASVSTVLEDRSGDLWIGTFNGIARYRPDRVPPSTVLLARPPSLSASTRQSAVFAALGESDRIEYTYQLDGGGWGSWSSIALWSEDGLLDGVHTLEVRARDYWTNVDESPEAVTFEIDSTPPDAVLASPLFGLPVQGEVDIRGTAADPRFRNYRVDLREAETSTWDPGSVITLGGSSVPVDAGLLATWDTSTYVDGIYDLRLTVADTLGLTGYAQVTVVVDNHAPYADQTTPAMIRSGLGGDVYTTNGEVHLYFPPNAFEEDAVVTIVPAEEGSVPESAGNGGVLVDAGFEISWSGGMLRKSARLELNTEGSSVPQASMSLAIYRSMDDVTWERLGGTRAPSGGRVSLAISEPGLYSLYADEGLEGGSRSVSDLALTPRVFSPSGNFADRQVGISFVLGSPGPVTVNIYDRSGRLIREVAAGVPMGAGENLIPWDGRDRDGTVVSDDLYFVTVEAFGVTRKQTLAVVK